MMTLDQLLDCCGDDTWSAQIRQGLEGPGDPTSGPTCFGGLNRIHQALLDDEQELALGLLGGEIEGVHKALRSGADDTAALAPLSQLLLLLEGALRGGNDQAAADYWNQVLGQARQLDPLQRQRLQGMGPYATVELNRALNLARQGRTQAYLAELGGLQARLLRARGALERWGPEVVTLESLSPLLDEIDSALDEAECIGEVARETFQEGVLRSLERVWSRLDDLGEALQARYPRESRPVCQGCQAVGEWRNSICQHCREEF